MAAPGKILWTPPRTRAVSLDGGHSLSLDSPDFNLGTGAFGFLMLQTLDAATPDGAWLLGKGPDDLTNAAGWQLVVERAHRGLALWYNDGQPEPNLVVSEMDAFRWGAPFLVYIGMDRVLGPRVAVNGALSGDGYLRVDNWTVDAWEKGLSRPVTATPGSLDNSEPLRLGWRGLVGLADYFRFDKGRCLPLEWLEQDYQKVRFGWPRDLVTLRGDFLGVWEWPEDLLDVNEAYEFTWEGGGAPVYADGWPYNTAPAEYVFERNYRQGDYQAEPLEQDDLSRVMRGDLQGLAPQARKLRHTMPFDFMPFSQKCAWHGAFFAGDVVTLHLDREFPPEDRVRITRAPAFDEQPNFGPDGRNLWSGEVEMESV